MPPDFRSHAVKLFVVTVAFLVGGYSAGKNMFPFSALRSLKTVMVSPPPSTLGRFGFDQAGRLSSDDQKAVVPCPEQTGRTAVLLLLGQSNAGNHGGQRFQSQHGQKVLNYFDKRCFVAESPLLGSDGVKGEYWTELGNLLVASGAFDQVVLIPVSISGSEISRWAQGGDINPLVAHAVIESRQANYRVTHVLFHQGEIDYVLGTSEDSYRDGFMSLVETLRRQDVTAPVYVSVTTKCLGASNSGTHFHSNDNSVSRAQIALPNERKAIRPGVNSDALLQRIDRFDDCHFGGSGAEKVAKAWFGLLRGETPQDKSATGAVSAK
jgi:hypothetical protein